MTTEDYLKAWTFAHENNLFDGHTEEKTFRKQSFRGCPVRVSVKDKIRLGAEYKEDREMDELRAFFHAK